MKMSEFVRRRLAIRKCAKEGGHYLDKQGLCHDCGILMDPFLYRVSFGRQPSNEELIEGGFKDMVVGTTVGNSVDLNQFIDRLEVS